MDFENIHTVFSREQQAAHEREQQNSIQLMRERRTYIY